MSEPMKCNQKGCDGPPAFRFTWPGKDEAFICAIHAIKMEQVAGAMGLYLQMVALTAEDYVKGME